MFDRFTFLYKLNLYYDENLITNKHNQNWKSFTKKGHKSLGNLSTRFVNKCHLDKY